MVQSNVDLHREFYFTIIIKVNILFYPKTIIISTFKIHIKTLKKFRRSFLPNQSDRDLKLSVSSFNNNHYFVTQLLIVVSNKMNRG